VLGASTNGLVGYGSFEDASGTTAADSSGNNYTAALSNAAWAQEKLTGPFRLMKHSVVTAG